MEHKGTIRIETERLILRPFTKYDIGHAYRNWCSDEKVTEFLRWPTHKNEEVTESVISGWIGEYDKKDFYQWAICEKGGENIGVISSVYILEPSSTVHVGYALGSLWWNRGYMTEALSAVTDFFFSSVGAQRVESQHDPENVASGRVMEKCGMKYEGTLRKRDRSNKGTVDASFHSILRSEWKSGTR